MGHGKLSVIRLGPWVRARPMKVSSLLQCKSCCCSSLIPCKPRSLEPGESEGVGVKNKKGMIKKKAVERWSQRLRMDSIISFASLSNPFNGEKGPFLPRLGETCSTW